jgi:putative intracellular protease/amidase
MSLRSVSVIVLDPVAVFEFGLAVEVFGVDRRDEGIEPFDFRVCGVEPGRPLATKNADPFTITPQLGLDSVLGTDLVIVSATLPRPDEDYPPEVLAVLRQAYADGATILSLCSGSFILGAAGLLDGRRCTTHWMYADAMQRRFPLAEVDPRVLFVEDDRIVTSAGTAAGIDASLHLVRKELGTAVATKMARRMVVPPQRDGGQLQYVDPHPGVPGGQPRRSADLGPGAPGGRTQRELAGGPGGDERAHVRPAVRGRDRGHPAQVVDPAAHPGRPQSAGGERSVGRPDRIQGRIQLRGGAARALPADGRCLAERLPAAVRDVDRAQRVIVSRGPERTTAAAVAPTTAG